MTKIFPHCTISVGLAPLADKLVNATALGLAYPAARQMAYTYCSVGISDLKPLTGTSADQVPHTKSRSLATA